MIPESNRDCVRTASNRRQLCRALVRNNSNNGQDLNGPTKFAIHRN